MKIVLRNYNNSRIHVEIPDDTEYIEGKVVSGDMIMTYPFYVDTSDERVFAFDDGWFRFTKDQFHLLDKDDFNIYDYIW